MHTTAGKVVIVGAGQVGSTFAFALQMQGIAREIVLIDADRDRAEGHALDLGHGNFFTPRVSIAAGDYRDCRNADLVVITAGASQKPGQSRLELVGQNVEICRSIVASVMAHTRDAILLMVTNPVDVLTYAALHFSGLPRHRVIGSGTVLDSARFRYLLSEHCRVDPQNVHAYVLGEHGDSEVVAWSLATLAGVRLDEYCSLCERDCAELDREALADQVRDSAYHVIEAKGSTNFAVALALAKIANAILRNGNSVLTVSRLLVGEYGIENVCLSMPTVVDRQGAARPVTPRLRERELAALRASAETIREAQRSVGLPERLGVLV
ncbi:MAG: L-lactate dehydrogenase [Phycisphaerae bacterium]|nr:L-lactate dehydrogenase [Phycisphaerae bacterium]